MKHKVDYKSKYFIIMDDERIDPDYDYIIEEMKDEHITDTFLERHVDACSHYGIPAYSGNDQALLDRIEKISTARIGK